MKQSERTRVSDQPRLREDNVLSVRALFFFSFWLWFWLALQAKSPDEIRVNVKTE